MTFLRIFAALALVLVQAGAPMTDRVSASMSLDALLAGSSRGAASATRSAQEPRVVLEWTVPRLVVGQQVRLRAHVESDAGERLDSPIRWRATSSSYVSLAADGRVTGVRPGRVTIIALAAEASARFDVEVIENTIGWIAITPERSELRVGETVAFRVEAVQRGGAALTGVYPTWSLAPGPGTVTVDGRFTPMAAGAHTVYAHIANRTASATVTVRE